jgi:hypothetical protein
MGHVGKGYDINQTFIIETNVVDGQDIFVTGGTYSSGTAIFTNNSGGTFSVSGFSTGGGVTFTGGTVSGSTIFLAGLSATTISGTTYLGLPIDIRVTGGTYSNGTAIFTNNTGGTFSISGLTTPFTGGTVSGPTNFTNGLSANTFSATTYLGLPIDIFVTGGTYSNGTAQFINNTGGTFSLTGFKTDDVFVTGGTYSAGTAQFINNTGGTFSITGFSTGGGVTFTGGTVSGPTNFTNGLSANTFSATTYVGLPTDIFVTGGTYSAGTAQFINNTGGTFSLTGFLTGQTDTYVTGLTFSNNVLTLQQTNNQANITTLVNNFSGLTVNGGISANTISANTISATTYINLPAFSGAYLPLSGGTVTGPTNFTSGVTANTISNTDYINFKTSPSVPSPTGGTLYYDSSENALSYKPLTNQNDVTVNLGQESLIRIYNNSGAQINNGQVVHITGSTSGIPTVALANASKLGTTFVDGLAQSSGVVTHNIPNDEYGFITNFGIVRDLDTSTFIVGRELFLSDTIDGGITDDPDSIAFTSRISVLGWCLTSDAINGKIFVSIENENQLQSLTQQEVNILLGNTVSTGVYEYTGATTASTTTTINVAPMRGWIVNNTYSNATNPDVKNIYYTGGTNISLTNISSADSTYLLINSGATLYQQTTFPTPQQRRENIFLGKVNHPNRTSILNINNTVDYDVSPMSSLRDLWSPIKLINQGIIPSPNGANLSFNTSAGTLWGNGINWHNNQLSPNNVSIAAKVPASFFYRTQTGGTSSSVSVIDPRNYDVGGVITSVGSSGRDDATNQRIYMYPTGVINVLYGQTVYANLTAAVAAINSETFIPYPNAESTGILIGILSVRNDIGTDGQPLTNTNYAKFTLVSKFGESFGGTGGLSTTTLQQAYDNSTTPEIVINAILDGLSVKNGTGNADNVTNVFEAVNTAGATTALIRADGYISGTTFQSNGFTANNNGLTATTVSATTYIGLPTDIRVTGGTYSNGTAEFTNNTGGTFSITGFSTGGGTSFTGGTVSGPTSFTNGLSANTFSATTYLGLPIDIKVTGGTYSDGTAIFTNNTGGTFSVSGFSTGTSSSDTFVTGATYSSNTFTYMNNTGGTFNVLFNTVTGLTVNGDIIVTGNTNISGTTTVSGDMNALGYLRSFNSTGDEGGEIFLNKAQTNTTLSGGVTFDVYQNRLRFFEQGGTARGAYIDLTAAGAGVSTNLLYGQPIVNFRGAVTVVQTNVEVAFGYYLIPANTFTTGDIIEIQCTWDPCDFTAASLTTTGIRSFTGNTPTPPSVGQSLANNGASGGATRYVQLQRENLYFSDATTLRVVNSPALTDVGMITTTAMGTPTFNTVIDNYIYPTMRAGVGTTATLRSFIISKK